jgi:mono/diheme cytochrome c family protein
LVAAVFFAATKGKAHSGGASTSAARIDPHVAAGAHDFVQFACSACHGNLGRGGVSPFVPALNVVGKSLTVKALTTIITHGLGESKNPKRPFMPVWGPVISKQQVADLVTYIRAGLAGAVRDPNPHPEPGPAGRHGRLRPLRLHQLPRAERAGRRAEPAVADKAIPPLSGQDFRKSSTPTRRSLSSFARAA